ncbi:MAG: hypothetical protein A2845_05495 [Candidatus Lloydbacteria bacterium RIFCSPHIGHO2_01_FULL_49_22]|uniref:Uncharacterized protein n=1 Tax=Candidatus Lloydbacteria bacterium RIFCSPHIGHO2_01_FULL_49_22 TaxID=1798658 RepID=A0A1G2CTK0_9BACT|nr:MAG: hypothetical protein A2845_05495 [Candidatus Lloydbacteria bacterium RIFCSPHIGHO2_01_FULL_49_22]OGZ09125.1 MAG: hypothetical protein A3C14_04020 [Candidatus Lloydbacteria bacterium RIFCSPHIGHO2_02_FULL_50_18]
MIRERLAIADVTGGQLNAIVKKIKKAGGVDGVQRFLSDELIVTAKEDTIIRITRPVKPTYPDWVKQVMHPELEDVGPGEYDLASIDLWLDERQMKSSDYMRQMGRVYGSVIYEDFKHNDRLKTCLGLRDAEEIQKKGPAVFRRCFGKKALCFWKSVVCSTDLNLHVPCIYVLNDDVVISWYRLDLHWSSDDNLAARFTS